MTAATGGQGALRDPGAGDRSAGDRRADAGAIAEQVLGLVRARSGEAEAEVNVHVGNAALTRFANGAIHQNVAEAVRRVDLRVALDGRVAACTLEGPTDDERLRRLVDDAFDAAAVSPIDPDWPGVAGPAQAPRVDHWDDATAQASPDDRAARVAEFVAAADGLVTAGALSTEALRVAFADTAGQAVDGRATVATLDGIARTSTSDGVARSSSVALEAIDARAAGDRAARKARESADPTDLEPGRYEVVLEPSCVADLIGFIVNYGFGGRAVEEGRSFVRLGEQQLDRAITLREDVTALGMSGVAFDPEGTPKRPVDIVRDGVPRTILHDRRSARKAGVPSTGNAVLGPNPFGTVPATALLEPGGRSLDELIGRVQRGLLVSDFWYTRVLDPRTLVVTGLTRNGVWLIEDGRLVRPVRNLRFTQSYAEAVAPGAVLDLGSDASLFPEGLEAAIHVPSLRLASWNFTGGAKG
jgi:predicted Zn-dependent protease